MLTLRQASHKDSLIIATLHALSWKSAYRGILTDHFLDNDLEGERSGYWTKKMKSLSEKEFVLIAEENGRPFGFIAVMDKPDKGLEMLIDNLHVHPELKGGGIGRKLMSGAAAIMKEKGVASTYLWVLDGNTSAYKFYVAMKGTPADSEEHEMGGKLVTAHRFEWRDIDLLIC